MGLLSWLNSTTTSTDVASDVPTHAVSDGPPVIGRGHFRLIEENEVSPSVGAVFDTIKSTMEIPFVPNILRSQGLSESATQGIWQAFHNVFLKTNLPMPLASMILYCISANKNCQYCSTVHLATCKTVGVDQDTLAALQNDLSALSPHRSRICIHFAVKCAVSPTLMTEEDFAELREEGINEEEIVEIVALAALGNYLDTIADTFRLEIDDVFKPSE